MWLSVIMAFIVRIIPYLSLSHSHTHTHTLSLSVYVCFGTLNTMANALDAFRTHILSRLTIDDMQGTSSFGASSRTQHAADTAHKSTGTVHSGLKAAPAIHKPHRAARKHSDAPVAWPECELFVLEKLHRIAQQVGCDITDSGLCQSMLPHRSLASIEQAVHSKRFEQYCQERSRIRQQRQSRVEQAPQVEEPAQTNSPIAQSPSAASCNTTPLPPLMTASELQALEQSRAAVEAASSAPTSDMPSKTKPTTYRPLLPLPSWHQTDRTSFIIATGPSFALPSTTPTTTTTTTTTTATKYRTRLEILSYAIKRQLQSHLQLHIQAQYDRMAAQYQPQYMQYLQQLFDESARTLPHQPLSHLPLPSPSPIACSPSTEYESEHSWFSDSDDETSYIPRHQLIDTDQRTDATQRIDTGTSSGMSGTDG
jgi:hypothetical protein